LSVILELSKNDKKGCAIVRHGNSNSPSTTRAQVQLAIELLYLWNRKRKHCSLFLAQFLDNQLYLRRNGKSRALALANENTTLKVGRQPEHMYNARMSEQRQRGYEFLVFQSWVGEDDTEDLRSDWFSPPSPGDLIESRAFCLRACS